MGNDIRKKLNIAVTALQLLLIAVFAFYVNRNIVIKGLYMDDLYMWSCYGEQNPLEFAFPFRTSTRFRPVYWLATWLQMAVIGTHVDRFVAFNIIVNILLAYLLYYMARRFSKSGMAAFLAAVCFLASRFAYYQIGQALGLMETLAQLLALGVLYLLIRFMDAEREPLLSEELRAAEAEGGKARGIRLRMSRSAYFAFAVILYFKLAFVHERYIALFPLFYLALLVSFLREPEELRGEYLRENRSLLTAPLAALAAIVLIRLLFIGRAVPAGTGGTEVADTFSLSQAMSFAVSQVYYLLGLNAGPEHLSGIPWEQTHVMVKALVKVSVLFYGVLAAMFVLCLLLELKEQKDRPHAMKALADTSMFALFAALCIGCSSVTIRVEMRWIYVSFADMLIFACFMIRYITEAYERACAEGPAEAGDLGAGASSAPDGQSAGAPVERAGSEEAVPDYVKESFARERRGNIFRRSSDTVADRIFRPGVLKAVLILVFAVYCALSIRTNMYYRDFFPKLYFWENQVRMNSLAEQTVEKYGTKGVFGKKIYILENSYGMSDFYARTFFKPYDKKKTAEGTEVLFIGSVAEIPADLRAGEEYLLLEEVPEERAYLDITPQQAP